MPEKASIELIKKNYKQLAKQWHPDKCKGKPEKCKKRMQEINEAFATIVAYCDNYGVSFEKEAFEKQDVFADYGEWWSKQFGNDPIWGNPSRVMRDKKEDSVKRGAKE